MLSPTRWIGDQFSEGRFTVRDLIDLAAADDVEAQKDHLHTVFEWYHQRSLGSVRALLGAALAIVASGIGASISEKVDAVAIGLGGTAVLFLLLAAYMQNRELGHLHREYIASLRLLSELRQLRPALREYPYLKEAGDGH